MVKKDKLLSINNKYMENLNNFNQENIKGFTPEKPKRTIVRKVFCFIKWFLIVFIVLFVVALILRSIQLSKIEKTNKQVEIIHATKITMEDVMGINLPPDPGEEGNKTIEGIDANKNGIRDDVELAIFKEYPNSAKTRAALLQYAFALQRGITQEDTDTVLATEISREVSRGSYCLGIINRGEENQFDRYTQLTEFARELVFNTEKRRLAEDSFFEKVRSYSEIGKYCDLNYSLLQN